MALEPRALEPSTVLPRGDSRAQGKAARSLRLLFVTDVPRNRETGMGNVLLSLAGALEQRGHDVELLLNEDIPAAQRVGRMSRIVFPWLAARRIAQNERRGTHYDVVVIHEPSAMAYAFARKRNPSLPPCVVMSHGVEQRCWDLGAERIARSLKTRVVHPLTELAQANYSLRHADAVVCLSSDDAEYIEKRLGVPAGRVCRVNNGVDAGAFDAEWAPSAQPGLLFVGSWIPRKGTREFVEAFAQLRAAWPGLRCTVLGSAVSEEAVRGDFAPADREAVDVFPSVRREELPRLLARDQIYVLPSHFEGMPLTLLEAMAAGLPCVTTDICGMRDVIQHGQNGYLIPPRDSAALIHGLSELLGSASRRQALGAAAAETAQTLGWDRAAIEWEKVFLGLAPADTRTSVARSYDDWHEGVSPRDELESDLENPWHRFARKHAGDMRQKRVLEAACGRGQLMLWLRRTGAQAVGVDFSGVALGIARQRLLHSLGQADLSCADVLGLPFGSESFDCVVSCETLEHVPNPPGCLREFRRVLRPGGRLILTTENYLNIWGLYRLYLAARHREFNSGDRIQPIEQWMFSPRTIRMVRQSGFRVTHTDGEGHHLLLLPGVNPPDMEARVLSRIPWMRGALHRFARHFFLVAEAI